MRLPADHYQKVPFQQAAPRSLSGSLSFEAPDNRDGIAVDGAGASDQVRRLLVAWKPLPTSFSAGIFLSCTRLCFNATHAHCPA